MDPAPAQLLEPAAPWANPIVWLCRKRLSRGFWTFFTAALFFDFGFAVYFFLFNLYLLDLHFNERAIGWITGALTLGSVAGTLPAGLFARRFGIRHILIACFIAAPILGAVRALVISEPLQIGAAFLAGVAMCLWGVCFLPTVAGLTTEHNRASGFSLIFSTSIGTSALGGAICGYLPQWLAHAGFTLQSIEVKRLILLVSCAIAALGLFAVLKMPQTQTEQQTPAQDWRRLLKLSPFLLRFLPRMALWTAALACFTPFANIYLARELHIPFARIGLIFSASQIIQFCAGLFTPAIFRKLGLLRGIVATQFLTAATLACLAGTHHAALAIALYLGFSALQWMSSPGLYNLVMSGVPEHERSTAASMTLFSNAILQSIATVAAGSLFVRFGYPHVLTGIACTAAIVALLFRSLPAPAETPTP